jgi:two-component system, OmpR family, sensor kinase
MSLRATLLAAFAYVLLVVIVVLEVPLVLNISRRVDAEVKAESSGQAQLIATTAGDQLNRRGAMQRLVDRSARALGGRVIVVDDTGLVLVDSAGPGLRGASYGNRPEILRALTGETAQGTRTSSSLNQDLLFTAVPVVHQGRPAGAVRVTQSVDAVHTEVRNDALALVGVGAAALALGLGVAWLVAGFLSRPLGSLARTARRVGTGDLDARAPETGPGEQREVAREFNEMASRLKSALEAQRDFVANASHQLRTPLTGLRLRLEAASERSTDPEVFEDLRAAEQEVARLGGLLNNLLTLAKEGQASPEPSPIRLATAARAARERWQADARRRRQRLSLSGEDHTVVLASQEDLGIVLDNLLENAIKYSPPGGEVTIEWGVGNPPDAADGRGSGFVAVCDGGPGLAAGEEERVLGRFFRGGAGSGEPGTGLGLAIVDVLARRWRGSVQLRNRASGGLRAEVSLPLSRMPPNRASDGLPSLGPDFGKSLPGHR